MMAKSGYFISFEGLEGAGKSTQVMLLSGRLRDKGVEVVVTREPGGTRIGEAIRAITHSRENVDLSALAEAYLMAAARAQHVIEIIAPAINMGKVVISDRFVDSSIAYQGYGRQLGAKKIATLNQPAVNGVLPNLTIHLDISVELGLSRRNGDNKALDRLDLESRSFYERVSQGYHKIAKKNTGRVVTIDASTDVGLVADKVWQTVAKRLNLDR